jgi:hypothetical protein
MLPASTPLGERATYWRIAHGVEWGSAQVSNSSAVYFQTTDYLIGALTVDGTMLRAGQYPMVVSISNQESTISYDFTLRVVPPTVSNATNGGRPFFEAGPWDVSVASPLAGFAGYEVYVTLKARTVPGAEVVEIREFNVADGAVLSNARCLRVCVCACLCLFVRAFGYVFTCSFLFVA